MASPVPLVVVVAPNGAGKSTMAPRLLSGPRLIAPGRKTEDEMVIDAETWANLVRRRR